MQSAEPRGEIEPAQVVAPRVEVVPPEPSKARANEAVLWLEVVSKETGAPIEGVFVVIRRPSQGFTRGEGTEALEGTLAHFPSTGADGRARFRVPPGDYELELRWQEAAGREKFQVAALAAGEERSLRLELGTENDTELRGVVRAAGTEASIGNAEVLLFIAWSSGSSWPLYQPTEVKQELERTRTGSEGGFVLPIASWRRGAMLRVQAPGFATGYASAGWPASEVAERALEFSLRPAAALSGTVAGATKGLTVTLHEAHGASLSVETDPEGRFTLDDLPAGIPFEVRLLLPAPEGEDDEDFTRRERRVGLLAEALVLEPGEHRLVAWNAPQLCVVRGSVRVAEGAERVRFLEVERAYSPEEPHFLGEKKYPDLLPVSAEGSFTLELASGTWWLGPPAHGADVFVPRARRLEIAEGVRELEVVLVLEQTLHVAGRVLDPDGRPVARARIESAHGEKDVSSAADGSFRYPMFEGDALELQAHARGFLDSEWTTVAVGQQDVVLQLNRAGELAVEVLDARGDHVEKGKVWALKELFGGGIETSHTVKEGDAELLLPTGRYTLVAEGGGLSGWLHGVELRAGDRARVTVVVDQVPAELSIRCTGEAPPFTLVQVWRDGLPVAGTVLTRDKARNVFVPAGRCEVRLVNAELGEVRSTMVDAVVGAITTVEFPPR
jgi:hypothetical protein